MSVYVVKKAKTIGFKVCGRGETKSSPTTTRKLLLTVRVLIKIIQTNRQRYYAISSTADLKYLSGVAAFTEDLPPTHDLLAEKKAAQPFSNVCKYELHRKYSEGLIRGRTWSQ
jgi:hypothetical protein